MKERLFNAQIIAQLMGVIFIFSGLSKSLDFTHFNSIIGSYHVGYGNLVGLCVIFSEIILGLFLVFNIAIKYAASLGILILLIFTAVYSYGYFFMDIQDCGCFGKIKLFNTNYAQFIIRNCIFIALLIYVYVTNRNKQNMFVVPCSSYIISLIIIAVSALMCGKILKPINAMSKTDYEKIALSDHALGKYMILAPDSTYMITVFSYDCPHCINSFGNLQQYDNTHYVDKIIGLCISNDEKKSEFESFFEPAFTIIELPESEINNISEEYPVSFFLKNDTIINIITGEIPSAFFVKDSHL